MSDRIVSVRLDESDLRGLKDTAKNLGMTFPEFMREIVDEGAKEAGNLAPGSGPLSGSIFGDVEGRGAEVQAYIKSDLFYAYFLNYGYKRHFVPWEKSKYSGPGIGFYTMKPGKPEGYFMEPGLEKAIDKADHYLDDVVKNL